MRLFQNPDARGGFRARPGLSLTEVLMAIFIMAIGMISLLVLFPIGIINMSNALRNSRLTYTAAIAEAQAEMVRTLPITGQNYKIRTDPSIVTEIQGPGQLTTTALEQYTATNPYWDPAVPGNPYSPWLFNPDTQGPPVLIDPQGYTLWPSRTIGTDAGNVPVSVIMPGPIVARSFGIRRAPVTFAPTVSQIRRTFMLEDELTFEPNGEARRSTVSGFVERERRHSWAYLWHRPRFSEIKVADLSIVMFQGRQIEGVSGFGNPPEPYFLGHQTATDGRAFIAGSTTARLKFATAAWSSVPVKAGDWLLDATVIPPNPNRGILAHFNGYFYKVLGVGDPVDIGGGEAVQEIELNRPAINNGYIGVMITGVAEVIEKNDGLMPPG